MYSANHLIRKMVDSESQPLFNLFSQIFHLRHGNNPDLLAQLMQDYESFQYDLLYGERYYMDWLTDVQNTN